VDAGSCAENASNKDRAFSSEVDAGSREENASNKDRAFPAKPPSGDANVPLKSNASLKSKGRADSTAFFS
jgi:hypothetical protein